MGLDYQQATQKGGSSVSFPKGANTAYAPIKRGSTASANGTNLIDFQNQGAIDLKIQSISIVPDNNFKTSGVVQIVVNDRQVFKNNQADFTDLSSNQIELPFDGLKLKPSQHLQIYIFSPDGATTVTATVQAVLND